MDDPQMPKPSNDNPGYYELLEDSSTRAIYQQCFQLKTTQNSIARTAEEDFDVFQQFYSKESNSAVTSAISEQSRKRNASSIQITRDTDVHKKFRSEICGMSDQVISTLNEGCINLDSTLDINAIYSRILLDNRRLTGNNLEFRITEDSFSESQVQDYIDNKKSCRFEQIKAMTMNTSQKENGVGKITHTEASKVKNVCLVDSMLAIPGPSCSSENFSQSNLCPENLLNRSPLKLQPLVETEQPPSMCFVCKMKNISEHWEVHDGKKMYRCCQCLFRSEDEFCLLTHNSTHPLPPFYCKVCKLSYSDASSHGETCVVCGKNLECKYELKDHYLYHEKEFQITCRICRIKIDEHHSISREVRAYECCFTDCKYRTCNKSLFRAHLYKHSHLKLFKCELCECRFKQAGNLKRIVQISHHQKRFKSDSEEGKKSQDKEGRMEQKESDQSATTAES